MKQLVIFGAGDMARLAAFYFENDSDYQVVAFTADREYCEKGRFQDKPLIPFDVLGKDFSPDDADIFVAVSYARMNSAREEKVREVKEKGYNVASYVSSRCSYLSQFEAGENCFILEDNTIQPYVRIGNNVWLWSGNHIGHDSVIEDNVYVSSHVVISGFCVIGRNSFLGVNATLHEKLIVAPYTLVGASAVITKSTESGDVIVPARSVKLEKTSSEIKI